MTLAYKLFQFNPFICALEFELSKRIFGAKAMPSLDLELRNEIPIKFANHLGAIIVLFISTKINSITE